MSVETLVLLALFIVLPLIQQLIRAMRQRNEGPPEPAERQAPWSPGGPPPPPPPVIPPLPDTRPPTPSDAFAAGGRVPASQPDRPVRLAPAPHRTMARRDTVDLRTRRDLRRAIVLMEVLGPCRASNPSHR